MNYKNLVWPLNLKSVLKVNFITFILFTSLSADSITTEKIIPNIKIRLLDGTSTTLHELTEDGPLMIDFWATWCVPCREEMPSLNKLIKSIDTENFSLVVIAAGRNSDKAIKKFFSEHNLDNLKSYKDPQGKVSSSINVFGLPTTIIIDQHQNELARFLGSTDWNSQEVIEFINAILRHDHPLYAE